MEPLEFSALDGRGVELFFALAGPLQARREYLSALGSLSYLFRNDGSRRPFREAADVSEVVNLFRRLLERAPHSGECKTAESHCDFRHPNSHGESEGDPNPEGDLDLGSISRLPRERAGTSG